MAVLITSSRAAASPSLHFPNMGNFPCFPIWEDVKGFMHVLTLPTLRVFWEKNPRAEDELRAWNTVVENSDWQRPADVLAVYQDADVIGDNRIIFNIGHNEFRLIVHFKYRAQVAMVCFVGTHKEYDRINPETV